jgi:Uma2 family endonuclease
MHTVPTIALSTFPAPLAPPPAKWTVPVFHALREAGHFGTARPILIRGLLMDLGPMNPPHAIALELTDAALRSLFGPGWRVRVQLPFIVGTDSDPLPDLVILPGSARDHPRAHPSTAPFVLEVSDSSLLFDLTDKADLYAAANVPEYWVLDVTARKLHVFRQPTASGYSLRSEYTEHESVTPLAAAGTIPIRDLLP